MGHFAGRGDIQVYVGDDGKVYATPAEEKVLADSADAFFGGNGNAPKSPPKPPPKPKKAKAKKKESGPRKPYTKETKPRRLRAERFEMVNCPVCDKSVKKGAGLTRHTSMMHKEA